MFLFCSEINISELSSANKCCLLAVNTTLYSTVNTFVLLLVVQDDVRQPDDLGGDVDLPHAAVLAGVPPQLVVVPFLRQDRNTVRRSRIIYQEKLFPR